MPSHHIIDTALGGGRRCRGTAAFRATAVPRRRIGGSSGRPLFREFGFALGPFLLGLFVLFGPFLSFTALFLGHTATVPRVPGLFGVVVHVVHVILGLGRKQHVRPTHCSMWSSRSSVVNVERKKDANGNTREETRETRTLG